MKTVSKIIVILILAIAFSFTGCKEPDPTVYVIGDTGPSGVGIVFYITNSGLSGLEAAPVDQSAAQEWSTITDVLANGTSALPAGIGTGSANTDAIIAQNSGGASAAKICRDYTGGGETDWFLPSKDELAELYTQSGAVGGFAANYYWSSSEVDADFAWCQNFTDGTQHSDRGKGFSYYVRAVRAF